MALTLLQASPADLTELITMQEQFYAIDQYPFQPEKATSVMYYFLSNSELGKMYLIKADEIIIGYVALTFCYSFEFGGRIAFLDEFYIKDYFRNQGLGSQALSAVINEAPAFNIKVVHLEAERHNEAGKALYRKFGFYDHDRHLMALKIKE